MQGSSVGGHLVARLTCVAPSGQSQRITWGALHLGKALSGGTTHALTLQFAAFALPPGHRLRLALLRDYWPLIWPDTTPAGRAPAPLLLAGCVLHLPAALRSSGAAAAAEAAGVPRNTTTVRIPTVHGVSKGQVTAGSRAVQQTGGTLRVTVTDGGGGRELGGACAGLEVNSGSDEVYELRVVEGDVQPVHTVTRRTTAARAGGDGVHTEYRSECTMLAQGALVRLTSTVVALHSGHAVLNKTWEDAVPAASL